MSSVFKTNAYRLPGVNYDTTATLEGGVNLSVRASSAMGEVEVARATGDSYIEIRFRAADARALAAELVAAADAVEHSVKGGADAR